MASLSGIAFKLKRPAFALPHTNTDSSSDRYTSSVDDKSDAVSGQRKCHPTAPAANCSAHPAANGRSRSSDSRNRNVIDPRRRVQAVLPYERYEATESTSDRSHCLEFPYSNARNLEQ